MKNNPRFAKLDTLKGLVRPHLAEYIAKFRKFEGKHFSCLNPAHPDRNPSANIIPGNPELFHCFSCNLIGDVHLAAHLVEGKPIKGPGFIVDNLYHLARMFGYEVPDLNLTADEHHDMDTYRAYSCAAGILISSSLPPAPDLKIQQYGWKDSTLKTFGVGSVPSYDEYMRQMTEVYGFDRHFLKLVDLDNRLIFSPQALVFTVCDEHGQPVGFAARNLEYEGRKEIYREACGEFGADSEEAEAAKKNIPAKFVNTCHFAREAGEDLCNRIYQKGSRLYGLHVARKNAPPLYIFEGYSDCVTAQNVGLRNACAIGATAFTSEHLNMILDLGIDHLVFVLDADEAGGKGTERFVNLVEEHLGGHVGLRVQIITMPDGSDDPDRMIREKGLDAFLSLEKTDIFTWKLIQAVKHGDDPDKLFESTVPLIVNEANSLRRLRLGESLSRATGIPSEVVWAEVTRRSDVEGQKLREEINLLATRTAKLLERNPEAIAQILSESQRTVERIHNQKHGYDLNRVRDYVLQTIDESEEDKEQGGLKTGWEMFDTEFGGIPRSDAFITIPGKPNQGKSLSLSSRLKTPDSWMLMRDVRVGDELASVDGRKSVVTGVFPQGVEKVWKVTFSDGRSVVASGDHLWKVHFVHQYSKGYGDEKHNGWHVFTTDSIRELCLNGNRKMEHRRVFVPMVSGDFGSKETLPVDPYLLGVLLGDGCLTGCSVMFSCRDSHIIEKVRSIAASLGLRVTTRRDGINHTIVGSAGTTHSLWTAVTDLGLRGTDSYSKFIPEQYMLANRESRLALLQGLMDTDGYIGREKDISYTSTSMKLAEGVRDLVRSVGGIAKITTKVKTYSHKGVKKTGAPAHQVNIRIGDRDMLFSLPRKKERAGEILRQPRLTIESIEPAGEVETQCIAVSHPSKLFITDDYIVTHNTSWLVNLAWRLVVHNENCMVMFHSVDDAMRWFLPRLWGSRYRVPSQYFHKAGFYLEKNPLVKVNDEKGERKVPFSEVYGEAKHWLKSMMADERLLPFDAAMLNGDVFSLEMRIRDLRKKYPTRSLIVFGDNFHLYESPDAMKEDSTESKTRKLSKACKNLVNVQHVTLIMTMELPKTALEAGKRPRMVNIKGSAGISYDSSANIGIYNDKKDMREKAQLVWTEYLEKVDDRQGQSQETKVQPILELVFDKSKINGGFDGNIYFQFHPESGQAIECPPEKQKEFQLISDAQQCAKREREPSGGKFTHGHGAAAESPHRRTEVLTSTGEQAFPDDDEPMVAAAVVEPEAFAADEDIDDPN